MKGRGENVPLLDQNREAVALGQYFYVRAGLQNARRANVDHLQRATIELGFGRSITLSICRPYALRSTVASSTPRLCCEGRGTSFASRMQPAQVPKEGLLRTNSSSAPRNPSRSRNFRKVVDSPPGITSPSTSASCSRLRTRTAPRPIRAARWHGRRNLPESQALLCAPLMLISFGGRFNQR